MTVTDPGPLPGAPQPADRDAPDPYAPTPRVADLHPFDPFDPFDPADVPEEART